MGLSPQKRAAVDKLIREAIGKGRAVEARLDRRYTSGKNWQPYERFLLDNGHTVFVNLAADPVKVTVSEKPNPRAVRKVEAANKRKAEREARKAKREARKAEKKAAASADQKAEK